MSSRTVSGDVVTADDVLPDDVEPLTDRDDERALVSMEELDVGPKGDLHCSHTYWYDDRRLYALEPDIATGYWLCCPACGLQRGQINRGEVPTDLRTI